ncbi:MAG: ATP-binding protein [Candidatus Ozemobacteraceae bacterium]
MDQKSDAILRAEKLYKNSREKFGYLIRETVANAIHATLIRQRKDKDPHYKPFVSIGIIFSEQKASLNITDNGEGFNDLSQKYFTCLDSINIEKSDLNLHPQGQGRLAILYFSDSAHFKSVYKDRWGKYKCKEFDYPDQGPSLFDIEGAGNAVDENETGTSLNLIIFKKATLGRASTFFSKYGNNDKLQNYFLTTFFPFFFSIENLELSVSFNNSEFRINRNIIEQRVKNLPFPVVLDYDPPILEEFKLWLLKTDGIPKVKNKVICFARQLMADLEIGNIEYEVDLPEAFDWLLTSDYFDQRVDQKGDKIEIPEDDVQHIQAGLKKALDTHFASEIEQNKKETRKHLKKVKANYHSIAVFVDEKAVLGSNRILNESEIISQAIEFKGKAEREYWTNKDPKSENVDKLLNSSLQIYIDHRRRILVQFATLIKRFDEDCCDKNELEDQIHDLFLKRGENLRSSENINHLHNLWILDDKYTIFSESFKTLSSRRGQEAPDIFLWIDDPQKVKELLILELKSTTFAHNAGDKHESMVAQVKRYAAQFYKTPGKFLNWDPDPDKILYSGFILARRTDVIKELSSNNIGGTPNKIPFLETSYFFNDQFAISEGKATAPRFISIRIEMFSYEDILELAQSRNEVFFKLLKGEFGAEDLLEDA